MLNYFSKYLAFMQKAQNVWGPGHWLTLLCVKLEASYSEECIVVQLLWWEVLTAILALLGLGPRRALIQLTELLRGNSLNENKRSAPSRVRTVVFTSHESMTHNPVKSGSSTWLACGQRSSSEHGGALQDLQQPLHLPLILRRLLCVLQMTENAKLWETSQWTEA